MWVVLEKLGHYDLDEDELPGLLDFVLGEGTRFTAEDETGRQSRRPAEAGITR